MWKIENPCSGKPLLLKTPAPDKRSTVSFLTVPLQIFPQVLLRLERRCLHLQATGSVQCLCTVPFSDASLTCVAIWIASGNIPMWCDQILGGYRGAGFRAGDNFAGKIAFVRKVAKFSPGEM